MYGIAPNPSEEPVVETLQEVIIDTDDESEEFESQYSEENMVYEFNEDCDQQIDGDIELPADDHEDLEEES